MNKQIVMSKLSPLFAQISKLVLLLIFALLTLLIPTYLRHPYLYFLFNILVVALGIESGLLKAITSTNDEKKPNFTTHIIPPYLHPSIHDSTRRVIKKTQSIAAIASQALAKPLEKAKVVEITLGGIARVNNKLKKCASKPSIFFIGGLESEHECKKESKKEEEWMEADREEMTKQELFAKAEHFIGNFYLQLKMQREE